MGLLDKMLGAMKYDDDEYDDEYYDDDEYDEKPAGRSVNKRGLKAQTIDDDADDKQKAPARTTRRSGQSRLMSNGM